MILELHLPWLELAVVVPLLGALWISRLRDAEQVREHSMIAAAIALFFAIGAWWDFESLHTLQAHDRWDLLLRIFGSEILTVDERSAPLIPLVALQYFVTMAGTMRTKVRRFSFGSALISESLLLALFSCTIVEVIVALLVAGLLPVLIELRARGKSRLLFSSHMLLFAVAIVAGCGLIWISPAGTGGQHVGAVLVALGVLIRSGVLPFHLWLDDLFDNASFGTALLFVTPMPGAYAAVRMLLPVAPRWVLSVLAFAALITAVYAAGMALVQREPRRFFSYLFLSHSMLVLVGLGILTPAGITGAFCIWLSVGVALTGLGLTLRSVESRVGRVSLAVHHGLHEHMPMLAGLFLLTGLASVGFPGTFGFFGAELLTDGVIQVHPLWGAGVILGSALNGIAILRVYFRLFTAATRSPSLSLEGRPAERWAAIAISLLILGGGVFPQSGIHSRYRAAQEAIASRKNLDPVPAIALQRLAADQASTLTPTLK